MAQTSGKRFAAPHVLAMGKAMPNPAQALAEGQRQLMAGQLRAVAATLRPALGDAVHRPEALCLLAIAAMTGQQSADAVAHAQEAVAARPDVARYQFVLGRARCRR